MGYPDEATWWNDHLAKVDALYAQANHTQDRQQLFWSIRTAYDIGAGMNQDQAEAKHLRELKAALGLSGGSHPNP